MANVVVVLYFFCFENPHESQIRKKLDEVVTFFFCRQSFSSVLSLLLLTCYYNFWHCINCFVVYVAFTYRVVEPSPIFGLSGYVQIALIFLCLLAVEN